MGQRPEQRARAAAALLAVVLLPLSGWSGAGPQDASAVLQNGSERLVGRSTPETRVLAPLLARIWDSGFFRNNEAVRREMLNNDYAFYGQGDPIARAEKKGLACFSQGRGGRDIIFLHRDVFSHFAVGLEGVVASRDVKPRVMAVLVHEFCHDLWAHVLDEGERAAFTREGMQFVADYTLALTDEERRSFLLRAGEDPPVPGRVRSYAPIAAMASLYPPRVLCGQELFAWLAERLFSTKEKIPRPLRPFYRCIIAAIPPDEIGALK